MTNLFDQMIPQNQEESLQQKPLNMLLVELGFDSEQHDQIKKDLKLGRIGLAKNRMPINTIIEDVTKSDITNQKDLNQRSLIDKGSCNRYRMEN